MADILLFLGDNETVTSDHTVKLKTFAQGIVAPP